MAIDTKKRTPFDGKNPRTKRHTVNQHFTDSVNELKDLRENNDIGEEEEEEREGEKNNNKSDKLIPTIKKIGKLELVSKKFEDKMTKNLKDGLGAKSEFYKEESETLNKISKDFTQDMTHFSHGTITEKFKPKFLFNDIVKFLVKNDSSKISKNENTGVLSLRPEVKVEESMVLMRLGAFYRNWTKRPTINRHISQIITIEQKNRKKTQRIVTAAPRKEAVTAKEMKMDDLANVEEETTHKIQKMKVILKDHVGESINLYRLCLDPNSFAKSVENLFHLSFLVKHGYMKLFEGEDGWPYVELLDDETVNEHKSQKKALTHITVSMSIVTYNELLKFLNIKESFF